MFISIAIAYNSILTSECKSAQTDTLGLNVDITCDLICLTLLFECCFLCKGIFTIMLISKQNKWGVFNRYTECGIACLLIRIPHIQIAVILSVLPCLFL